MRILITELIEEIGIYELKHAGIRVDYDQNLRKNREKLLNIISSYDGLIVRNETIVDKELLDQGENLKVIGRLGVGLDNIDIAHSREKNIPVVVAKHANATSVAEYVIASMLDAYRRILVATEDVRLGKWDRKRFTGIELAGKTLGLFGLGEISQRVANRAVAFGINLLGYDPFLTPYEHIYSETGVKPVESIDKLLTQSDFISIHVPLNNTTKNMFNKKSFTLMKPSAYLINTARGGIVNERDLYEAVKSKKIAGAYLDVLETEPILVDSPLLSVDSIHITPHIAGLTIESQKRTSTLVAREIIKILNGHNSHCQV